MEARIIQENICEFIRALNRMTNRLSIFMRIGLLLLLFFCQRSVLAEELYIISTTDGSQIMVKEYSFTDEQVRFITPNDLPGFIGRDQFAGITNMVGVPPRDPVQTQRSIEEEKKKEIRIWLAAAVALVVLYVLFVLYVTRRRKRPETEEIDIHYGRSEREPLTQGHLSFKYRGPFGRTSDWVIEVRRAYQEDGIFFVEGVSVITDKRKTFQADQVIGDVTDLSSGQHGPMEHFFAGPEE